jgi:hypothetical protein
MNRINKPIQFHEAGVSFCREATPGWLQFQYNWMYIPTLKFGVGNIWLYPEVEYAQIEFVTLINHWNNHLPKLWKYWQ